ncbi:TPA: nucleotidyltransferase domain-containing protein [bacterium]|nr:nucleotidyltransferase domain-containing protein [bacterium]
MERSIIEILKSYFTERDDIILAYMFGSQVKGKIGPLSDFDISILPTNNFVQKTKYYISSELSKILGKPVDIVIFNRAPIELRFNVISNNILLFAKDEFTRIEVEATTMSLYFDYLPELKTQRNELLREVTNAGSIQRYREAFRKTEKVLAKIRATANEATL